MIEYKPWAEDVAQEMAQKACNGIFTCLDIEVSDKCPYRCVYCESPFQNRNSSLDIDKVCSLLETKQFKWVYICGIGEPTYSSNEKQLLQILECCKKNNVRCSIFTNLSNLSEEIIGYIKDGILFCIFKFDSQSSEVVGKLYNPVNIEEHIANIMRLVNLVQCDGKTTNVAASIVPTTYNVKEIPSLIRWCIEHNIFPLVAQLEYTGAAKDVYGELVLDDDVLSKLKEDIEEILGEEYHVPFCPAVLSGFSITYDNKIVVDRRTGLSCHSFWLDDPDLDIICDDLSSLLTVDDITKKIIEARIDRYDNFMKNRERYKNDILGGCGGNRKDIFRVYDRMLSASYRSHQLDDYNLKINRFVYMDNNATTKISDSVREAMEPYLGNYYANPNSKSQIGLSSRMAVEKAREQIAKALGSQSAEIYFTSCGSESNSWAIKSCIHNKARAGKRIIISTEIEHESVLDYLSELVEEGYKVYNIPITTNGDINIDYFLESFSQWDDVSFASVMLVNNETGVINDIKRLAAILHEYHIPLHCDAVQALGKIRIDVTDLGIDYLSISGHKVHAPKGIGAMYARNGSYICPLIYGSQESKMRGGTENVAYAVAFGQAVANSYSDGDLSFDERIQRIASYRKRIEEYFLNSGYHVIINGENAERIANTINMGFENVNALQLALLLESRGIYVSNGSACNIEDPQKSHVLKAMNSSVYENGAIRVSLSEYTQERDISYFIDNLRESIKKIKGE